MIHEQYIDNFLGKGVDMDGKFGSQCVDLIRHYFIEAKDKTFTTRGNAIDWRNNDESMKYDGFIRIENEYGNVGLYPKQGDIVLFATNNINPYGHIAVCHEADGFQVTVLEQNGGAGTGTGKGQDAIRLFTYGYLNILGRYTPIVEDISNDDAMIDLAVRSGVLNGQNLDSMVTRRELHIVVGRLISKRHKNVS